MTLKRKIKEKLLLYYITTITLKLKFNSNKIVFYYIKIDLQSLPLTPKQTCHSCLSTAPFESESQYEKNNLAQCFGSTT